jgi:alkylation response protein AidB-like acyl-CoA dehydrogenase
MDFAFSEEQEELRATLRRFFEAKAPPAELRRAMESPEGFDRAVWKQMSEELGLAGVHVPEPLGGQGFGFLELGIVLEEMGRVLFPSPYLSHALATCAVLNAAGAAQARALVPPLAAGAEIAALALVEEAGIWSAAGIALEARPEGDALRLSGVKPFVCDAHAADRLVVGARLPGTRGEEGVVLCTLPASGPGVRVTPLESMDPLRRQSRVELDGARAAPLGTPGAAAPALARTLAQAAIALSSEMVGGAQRCLDMAVGYAKQRVQFARPIGSFQAIQHKAAEVLLELELARSASWWASWVASGGSAGGESEMSGAAGEGGAEDLFYAAHLAKSVCGDAYRRAAAENVQIHGGIGFTWEHDAHLHYKRAHGSDTLFGDATYHRAALARGLGFGA